ncbi:hypothetical protein HMSSN036_15190 [Paenibacillus macerans]|nr:hypothetical protein HMSSN036_15190 [Paenibacillus macerans]
MKGKAGRIAVMVLLITVLGGCGRSETAAVDNGPLEPIRVDLEVTPDTVESGGTVTFTAKVGHRGETSMTRRRLRSNFGTPMTKTPSTAK